MSDRYPGGIIVANPTAPTTTVASGIWTLEQQAYYKAQGTWPSPPYLATNSLRFRASASAYLNRTPASAGNQKTWTWSSWLKRGSLSSSQCLLDQSQDATNSTQIYIQSSDSIRFFTRDGGNDCSYDTNAVFRDCSSWYHVVVAVDTTQATASDRVKIYINGTLQTLTTSTNVSQNANTYVNSTNAANIARIRATTSAYLDGYLSEVHFVDGQALTPSSFGATNTSTGVWQPTAYTGTYGTNGFYLPFSDIALTSGSNAGLGKDFSGNGNYWNTNNISVTSGITYDAMTDVPTLTSTTAGNYCVMNPLDSLQTVADGNLAVSAGATWYMTRATMGMSSGKWYWETQLSGPYGAVGISKQTERLNQQIGETTGACGYVNNTGEVRINNVAIATYATWSSEIIGMAYDADNGKLWFSKDGTWLSGDPASGTSPTASGLSGTYIPGCSVYSSTEYANFGQRPFTYTPPSGFKALNTYNLATPTVLQGDDYFAATLYTGNGSSQSITNTGFQPDLVWTKSRSNAYNNTLVDAVRGVSRSLVSDLVDAEDYSPGSYVTAFNSNGFSVGTGTGSNGNGATYVAWQWKGGNSSGLSNNDGSITSTVSASQTSGFSIVTYTGNGSAGATIGHGLGVAPSMIIVKSRVNARSWNCYHSSLGNTKAIYLNSTSASASNILFWNNTSPNSTVFTVGSGGDLNANGETFVAYCFSQVAGFSAMGTYTGDGSSTSGPFIYTGFRPAYIMIKRTDATGDWPILDTARNTYNVAEYGLYANTAGNESSFGSPTPMYDFLSNGIKIRTNLINVNASGGTYIYMAFAENPFKYALAR